MNRTALSHLVGRLLLVVLVSAGVGLAGSLDSPMVSSASGPTGPPPDNRPEVPYGHLPGLCTTADVEAYGLPSGAIYGWAWSPVSDSWALTPYCMIVWSNIGITSPVVTTAGAVVTLSLNSPSNQAGFIPQFGGASWTGFTASEVVAGCTTYDISCSLRIGNVGDDPPQWVYRIIGLSAPQHYITWVPQVGCTEATPCPGARTNAWTAIAVVPVPLAPDASFTSSVTGAELAVSATSTDPVGLPLTHEWDFGDGTTAVGANPSHTYREAGTYTVRLRSTNSAGLSDEATETIDAEGQPLSVEDLVIQPDEVRVGTPASATFRVVNEGPRTVSSITATTEVDPAESMAAGALPAPFDLEPGESREVEVALSPARGGEAFVRVGAGGTFDGAPTSARSIGLPVDIAGPALRLTASSPDPAPKQGFEFEVSVLVENLDERAVAEVVPSFEPDPAERVTIVSGPEPVGPVDLAAVGEPGSTATFTWRLTAERAAWIDIDLSATGTVDDATVTGETTARVDLESSLEMEWEITARFEDADDAVTTPDQVVPDSYEYTVFVRSINDDTCTIEDHLDLIFQIDGQRVDTEINGPCGFSFTRPDIEPFDLEGARVTDDDIIDSVGEIRIEARDFFVVSIGDSLSSGEGNPSFTSPIWTNEQCHRSAEAGPAAAARKLEAENPHSVVTFLHLACSGASTATGMTGSYAGIVPGPWLAPQIPEIARFANGREIDAVMMSVGANDVEFGKVIAHCVTSLSSCYEGPFVDRDMETTLAEFVGTRMDRMPYWFARNHEWLTAAGVAPERVYSVGYPRITRDADGNVCTALNSLPTMTETEWLWNENWVERPLNAAVVEAASKHGWRPVHGLAASFERHGYCNLLDTWVTSLLTSLGIEQWSVAGAFHPNRRGHQDYRDQLYAALAADLIGDGEPRAATPGNAPSLTATHTPAGADRIEVRNDRFRIGDRVVINPGTPIAEVRTITAKGSLVFNEPLANAHPAGVLIVLDGTLDGALDQVPPPSLTPPPGEGPVVERPPAAPPVDMGSAASEGWSPAVASVPTGTLPATGSSTNTLVVLATSVLGLGVITWRAGRRRRPRRPVRCATVR